MFPWWFILLIIFGILLGMYFFYCAYCAVHQYEDEDVIDTSAAVVLGSVLLGFALLGLMAFIFG